MKVLWLITPLVAQLVSGQHAAQKLFSCPLASARLRMAVAVNAWSRQGNENLFLEPPEIIDESNMDWRDVRICMVPKFSNERPLEPWLKACHAAKASGSRLVLDICDFPFGRNALVVEEFYSRTLRMADEVVVNSERMAQKLAPYFRKRITIIEDAVLDAMATPAFFPSERLNLLWFGHPSNLRFLKPWIGSLIESGPRPCRLVVVTQDGHGVREDAQKIQAQHAPGFAMEFVEWSLESTRRELAASDLVVLPSNPADRVKGGVSANRIVEVLNAGRFPVASPLHSYLPFADSAWLGDDLIKGIEWAQAHPEAVIDRIRCGQTLVARKFAIQEIGQQWCELLEAVAARREYLMSARKFLKRLLG